MMDERTPPEPAAAGTSSFPDTMCWEADGTSIYLAGTPIRIAAVLGLPVDRDRADGGVTGAEQRQAQVFARVMAGAPAMMRKLREAAETFRGYERHHRAKPDHAKAEANAKAAREIEALLASLDSDTPAARSAAA